MDLTSLSILILAIILVLAGLVGLIIPVLPGPALICAGLIFAAWADNFSHVGGVTIVTLICFAVLAHTMDIIAASFGVKKFGASRWASIGAFVGGVAGLFFGLVGVFVGPFIGAFIAELIARNRIEPAFRAGVGSWVGILLGSVAKVALGFAMIGIYIIARFF
jgi:uncharacterized protein YqgC (DUF456 family)